MLNKLIQNKVVIITGATSMIGASCAKLLAEQGAKLMLTGRSKSKLEAIADDLPASVEIAIVNNTSEVEIETMVQKTLSCFGCIDAVIQNTAIYPWKSIEALTLAEWKEALDVNLTGVFLTTQACFSAMKQNNLGKFVLMSSIAGENIGLPHMSAYATSKAGLNGFMRAAAIEFAKYNININCISPGRMYDEKTLSIKECQDKLKPMPLKRFIKPIDVASMAMFLISEKSDNITGQNMIIDGGQSVLGEESHIQDNTVKHG